MLQDSHTHRSTDPAVLPGSMNSFLRFILESLPLAFLAYCITVISVDSAHFAEVVLAKDSLDGSGLVESLTFFVLLVGIIFGLCAVVLHWKKIPSRLLRFGLIAWILGCVYFAGEEISWGQWYFGWSTPETLSDINRQDETNLHNTTSWLNEKPRTVVELWFLFAGLFVAVARLSGKFRFPDSDWREWINPHAVGVSACIVFLFSKFLEYGSSQFAESLSNSEIRELIIAYFLSIYLLSTWLILRRRHPETVTTQPNNSTTGLPLSAKVNGRILGEKRT